MRALMILALLAVAAFASACQATAPADPSVQRKSIYGQPCTTRVREAGLCRTTYRPP